MQIRLELGENDSDPPAQRGLLARVDDWMRDTDPFLTRNKDRFVQLLLLRVLEIAICALGVPACLIVVWLLEIDPKLSVWVSAPLAVVFLVVMCFAWIIATCLGAACSV